jgi:uncharacterized protein YhfF
MHVPEHLRAFWHAYAESVGGADESRFYEAFSFGDSQEMADELADLVLRGIKRATAGAVWSYEAAGKRLPQSGDLSIVTKLTGQPLSIIETQAIEVVPFSEVTAEFASTEGKGDGSLSFWREEHRRYFTRECARSGRRFSEDMLVACERFRVVLQPKAGAA